MKLTTEERQAMRDRADAATKCPKCGADHSVLNTCQTHDGKRLPACERDEARNLLRELMDDGWGGTADLQNRIETFLKESK